MARPAKSRPERSCIVCRRVFPKRDLVRIVRTPAGEITVDSKGKISGRGLYFCGDAACWKAGFQGDRLERALRLTSHLPPETRERLHQQAEEVLKLARRET
ncbi:MAG: YlxR family protein [Chloroflexi bacterium]|nr:YlxR family protein [Chloroflexota bacterium]